MTGSAEWPHIRRILRLLAGSGISSAVLVNLLIGLAIAFVLLEKLARGAPRGPARSQDRAQLGDSGVGGPGPQDRNRHEAQSVCVRPRPPGTPWSGRLSPGSRTTSMIYCLVRLPTWIALRWMSWMTTTMSSNALFTKHMRSTRPADENVCASVSDPESALTAPVTLG